MPLSRKELSVGSTALCGSAASHAGYSGAAAATSTSPHLRRAALPAAASQLLSTFEQSHIIDSPFLAGEIKKKLLL